LYEKQSYAYKVTAHTRLLLDVYRMPKAGIRPALIWLHGGALIFGNRETLPSEQLMIYLNAGYTVISVDYRLAPETKLAAIVEDVQDACRWVRECGPDQFAIDPDRMAVVGHSAGGYLTLMTGFCVRPRPQALVAFYGYGDITGHWYSRPNPYYRQFPLVPEDEIGQLVGSMETTGTPFSGAAHENRARFYLYCRQQGLWPQVVAGHHPDQEWGWYAPYCPVRNMTPDYPPTLLLHGNQDTDVPVEQSVLMAQAFQQQGVEHELAVFAGQGHGFDHAGYDDPVVAEAFDRVLRFLEKHLV
jgi:acetyl esterase/lipase